MNEIKFMCVFVCLCVCVCVCTAKTNIPNIQILIRFEIC